MKSKKLLDAVGNISDQYIEEAAPERRVVMKKENNRKYFMRSVVTALAAAAVVIGILTIPNLLDKPEAIVPSTPREVVYSNSVYDWMVYQTAPELIEAADMVLTGKVTGISFQMFDQMLYTMYDISVDTVYKGEQKDTVTIRVPGGLQDVLVDEQLAALGGNAGDGIPLVAGMPEITVGDSYLLVLHQPEDGSAPTIQNADQSVFNLNDPDAEDMYAHISLQDIISYFD